MTLKNDAKFQEKLTCGLEYDMRNVANFHQNTWKFQNWDFDRILLSKVENVCAWNSPRSSVSWQWRMTQNLKRNWLVVSKFTWGIWQILTWTPNSLKILHFNGLFLIKVYNVWAIKSTVELCLIALKIDAKFEWKLTCAFKSDMRTFTGWKIAIWF